MQTHPEFVTLMIGKTRRPAHHSFGQVQGNLRRSSHAQESQAQSFTPIRGSVENINKFKSSWNHKHVKLLKDNRKMYLDSLERNFVNNSGNLQGA